MKTSYGLEFSLMNEVDSGWSDYDKKVASCHLANVGVVIVDTGLRQPIDNECDLEEIYRMLEEKKINLSENE